MAYIRLVFGWDRRGPRHSRHSGWHTGRKTGKPIYFLGAVGCGNTGLPVFFHTCHKGAGRCWLDILLRGYLPIIKKVSHKRQHQLHNNVKTYRWYRPTALSCIHLLLICGKYIWPLSYLKKIKNRGHWAPYYPFRLNHTKDKIPPKVSTLYCTFYIITIFTEYM